MEKIRFTCFVLLMLTISGCDGGLSLRGRVIESYENSNTVPVDSAKISFFPWAEYAFEKLIPREFYTDSLGYFDDLFVVAPGKKQRTGVLLTTKSGYAPDTFFFEYRSLDSVNVIIKLDSNR